MTADVRRRAVLFGISLDDGRRDMTISFPGRPSPSVDIPTPNDGSLADEAPRAAVRQLESYSSYELELISISAGWIRHRPRWSD